jgi:type IV pilus assembly protein PilM
LANNEVISIDIGSKNTKIVIGKQQNNNIIINSAFMLTTPANSIQDGKIMDMEALVVEIKGALNQNKIKTKKAIITIESTSIIRREIELPMAKAEELDAMVVYEIEQYLPIMLNEYVIEYKITEEFMEEKLKKYKILVAALPKAIAEEYIQLVKELELIPAVLDINSNAISKLLSTKTQINSESYNVDNTIAVLDIGYNNINLTIVSNGNTKFSRLITLGGNDIDINIANSFNLEMRHAEEKKMKEGNLSNIKDGNTLDSMFNDMIRFSVDRWIEEIQRMFQYFTSRDTHNRINSIYLYGGSSNLNGLEDYIKTSFNMPVHRLKSFGSIKTGKLDNLKLEYYLNSIGAIIRK